MNAKKRVLVFASGTKEGGGSGFQELVEYSRAGSLKGQIVGVVSNIQGGGVERRAQELGIKFVHFPKPWTAERYVEVVYPFHPDLVALSGWLKYVAGLNPRMAINIHPGPLPGFGGQDYHGHHVHEMVMEAYRRGDVKCSAVCMHFVTPVIDDGPIFFRRKVLIRPTDTPDSLGSRVNEVERAFQAYVTNRVLSGEISWDGVNRNSLVVPTGWNLVE